MTIKSIMTKSTISGKMVETIEESTKRKTKLERERESIDLFCHEQLRRNMKERRKRSKKKFIRKLRWKRKC